MILHTPDLGADPLPLEGVLPAEILELEEEFAQAEAPIVTRLVAQRTEEELLVSGTLQTTVRLQCGRCCAWIDWPIHVNGFLVRFQEPLDEWIDLTPAIREDILLALPIVATCPPGQVCEWEERQAPPAEPVHGQDVWKALDQLKE
ncbi:YceD family protein [Candidatus Methylacidithermus pantelleriae]|uniref:DUF177 domain-containing protein n=1 Tax=Candidatus Methylacidithermus pantelleriae TaxID=2744239 RepID=A0A8J2BNF8_9BACT|nr:hypothetical protein [Candidatus Methylacidithermus pantelleriae]CAF0704968.1 conserved hypothetical protein [Candidatus Methylacidithermus pantelleriae]